MDTTQFPVSDTNTLYKTRVLVSYISDPKVFHVNTMLLTVLDTNTLYKTRIVVPYVSDPKIFHVDTLPFSDLRTNTLYKTRILATSITIIHFSVPVLPLQAATSPTKQQSYNVHKQYVRHRRLRKLHFMHVSTMFL